VLALQTSIILGDPVVSKASPLHCQAILLWNNVPSHLKCGSRPKEGSVSGAFNFDIVTFVRFVD